MTIAPPVPSTAPPVEPDDLTEVDRNDVGEDISVVVTALSAGLATVAAALTLSGVFAGAGARLLAAAVAFVGPALVAVSYRTSRPAVVQYLVAPIALGLGASVALAGGGTGSATLPTLVADAIRGGGLGQPPVAFAPGWRFLLVTLLVLLGAGATSLGIGLRRPRLAVAAPVPAVVGGALVQPAGSAATTSALALVALVTALTVAAGASRTGDSSGGRSFELLRLVRGAVGVALLGGVLVALASTGLLLPSAHDDQVVPPRPPTASPPLSDRVLYTIRGSDRADAGPFMTGVLDSYRGGQWLLPSYDRKRLLAARAGTVLPNAPAVAARHLTVTVAAATGRDLPIVDLARTVSSRQLRLRWDPQTSQLSSEGQQAPPGTSYTVDAGALPTAAQLAAAPPPPAAMSRYLDAPAAPPEVARVLAAGTGTRFARLQQARSYLYAHVVAAGKGEPQPVPVQRVADMFAGGHATPFEITAAEALLARWVGVPARIGFGYAGGVVTGQGDVLAIHPSNGATWLQTWWSGIGWVSIVGRPAQAVTPTSLDEHRHATGVRTNGQLALVVHVPVELASLRALYDDVRFYVLVTLPWVALLAVLLAFHPVALRGVRRLRRRRWAAARGSAGRLLVAYAELRDSLADLGAEATNATPLEFCSAIDRDDEHWELAWLVTRALWGDLARDLRPADVEAGEEMARSVRRRVAKAQRLTARASAAASRRSLRDPWTTDVPNVWPRHRLLRDPARLGAPRSGRWWPLRRLPLLRRPVPGGALVIVLLVVALGGCARAAASPPPRLPSPFVPITVGPYALRESTAAARAYAQAGSASLVTDGHVWTVVAPDGTVKGSLQAAAFKAAYRGRLHDVQRGVRRSIGSGDFVLTRVGTRAVYVLRQSEELLLLWFPSRGSYYELLDVRSDFGDAQPLLTAILDYQQGVQSRPLPPELDPRRGGDS